ncbi:hypothetical protein AgCh_004626 [Apium graveolens]
MDKLKLASSSLTERFKSGTAKMKEILQSPTAESKLVDDATSDTLSDPNWGLNLRICSLINTQEISGTEVVKSIKKKLWSKSVGTQMLCLELLETLTSNCEKVFSEVASEKLLEEMVKVIEDSKTDDEVVRRGFEMVRAWGQNDDLMYLPVFHQTYMALKARGILSGGAQTGDVRPEQYTLESYIGNEQMTSPPGQYPIPNANDQTSEYNFGSLSLEDNKEFLVVTRNSLDLLSSILDSGAEPAFVKEDLTVSMLEKCKQSLPVVQRIAETTNDDEAMLFEALSLHDELRQVISRCDELEASLVSGGQLKIVSDGSAEVEPPVHVGSFSKVDGEASQNGDAKKATSEATKAGSSMYSRNNSDDLKFDATKVDSAVHVSGQSTETEKALPLNADTAESLSALKKLSSPPKEKLEN